MKATGGTITDNGSYKVHTFSSDGDFTVWGKGTVKVLVVGGGAGCASATEGYGKGGGGGEVIYEASFAVSTGVYPVVIGAGGATNVNGGDSTFSTLTGRGGLATGYSRTGNAPGSDAGGSYGSACGGGAGDGGAGGNASGGPGDYVTAGAGGAGVSNSITGSSVEYGGGGAGGRLSGGSQIGGAHRSRVYGDGASGMDQAVQGAYLASKNGVVIISFIPTEVDSGIRVYGESIVYETLDATHKVRFNKGGTIVGLPLVATTNTLASKVRVYDGAAVKSLVKCPPA